jgi:hypothetical protein
MLPAAVLPADAADLVQLVQRIGAARVDHGQPRQAVDQSQAVQFRKRFAEGARVAQVAARHHDPVGHFPTQRLEHPVHDRLLAFEPERVDAVDQIDAQIARDLLDPDHRVVEIALDLHRQRAVFQRLGQFAVSDLARSNKDHRFHQPGDGAVHGQRSAGVAGRRARRPLGTDVSGMGESRGHAVVFEAARRIQALVLQEQPARLDADVRRHAIGLLQQRLALADRDDLVRRGERQQFMEPPHAAEAERIVPPAPLLLEILQLPRDRQTVPVVLNVQQIPAPGAGDMHFGHAERSTAVGSNALLKSDFAANHATEPMVERRRKKPASTPCGGSLRHKCRPIKPQRTVSAGPHDDAWHLTDQRPCTCSASASLPQMPSRRPIC